eukprot:TRINITY_DN4964_c0_g2_i3.p1 TRINITY_DN4964_c0_g2~~TRINITY_DN4964_c0_g2_i3.p1  ORF type:complete len:553 (+),score=143.24 TRINITY_DN4964_c0_g2_i3:158-1816(+)
MQQVTNEENFLEEGLECQSFQYGMSKVICDLYCVEDAVKAGDKSILATIKKQSDALTDNLKALFEYFTGTMLDKVAEMEENLKSAMLPSSQALLAGPKLLLRGDVDAREMLSALDELPGAMGRLTSQVAELESTKRVHRNLLDWHKDAGSVLLRRVGAALAPNGSAAPASASPAAAAAATAAVREFEASLRARAKAHDTIDGAASAQTRDSVALLSGQVAKSRFELNGARSLLEHLRGGVRLDAMPDELADRWNELTTVFLNVHEKHTYFVAMKNRALDLHSELLDDVKAYTGCATNLQEVHARWERAIAAEDRASEVLLEAWATTLTAEEQIQNVIAQGLPESIVTNAVRNELSDMPCGSLLQVASYMHERTVMAADRALLPLVLQLNAYSAIAKQQKANLVKMQLRVSQRIGLSDAIANLERLSADIGQPNGTLAATLAAESLAKRGGAVPCSKATGASLLEEGASQRHAASAGVAARLLAWTRAPLEVMRSMFFAPDVAEKDASRRCDRICYEKLAKQVPVTEGVMRPMISLLSLQDQQSQTTDAKSLR